MKSCMAYSEEHWFSVPQGAFVSRYFYSLIASWNKLIAHRAVLSLSWLPPAYWENVFICVWSGQVISVHFIVTCSLGGLSMSISAIKFAVQGSQYVVSDLWIWQLQQKLLWFLLQLNNLFSFMFQSRLVEILYCLFEVNLVLTGMVRI